MAPELTQQEMAAFVAAGKTMVWQFRTLYQIDYSANLGNGEYYLRKVRINPTGCPVTMAGRFFAMVPAEAYRY